MSVGEFDFIQTYMRPLTRGSEFAANLSDDAAHLPLSALSGDLVITADTLVAGRHFLPHDPIDTLGRKALRVNLSDLAAKGAKPFGFFLSLALPSLAADWLAEFANGLALDVDGFDVPLLGGDTTRTDGPLVLSITALGQTKRAIKRNGAQSGDLICVSGPIGWGALGLQAALGKRKDDKALTHYRLPEPQLALGLALSQDLSVSSSMDISDGLIADCRHLAKASGLHAQLELDQVPLADPDLDPVAQMTGGDDYKLLFSCSSVAYQRLVKQHSGVTKIGKFRDGGGVSVINAQGQALDIQREGFDHGGD